MNITEQLNKIREAEANLNRLKNELSITELLNHCAKQDEEIKTWKSQSTQYESMLAETRDKLGLYDKKMRLIKLLIDRSNNRTYTNSDEEIEMLRNIIIRVEMIHDVKNISDKTMADYENDNSQDRLRNALFRD